jgi:hypothetical protein
MASYLDQPFQASSAWNKVIPKDATYKAEPKVWGLTAGLTSWQAQEGVSVPVYRATSSDPVEKVLYNPSSWGKLISGQWKNAGNSAAVENQILDGASEKFIYTHHTYQSQSTDRLVLPSSYDKITTSGSDPVEVHAPAGTRPVPDADGHLVVQQPDGKTLETFGTVVLSDGTIVAQSYKMTDPSLKGDGWQNGVTASMLPVYAGLIRDKEYSEGEIDHAMKLVVPASLLNPSYVYPAYSFDRDATTNGQPYSGSLPMGARLAIPWDVDLAKLGFKTEFGKIMGKAAQEHGFIVTERGGSGLGIVTERGVKNPELDQYDWQRDADLQKILDLVKRVGPETKLDQPGVPKSDVPDALSSGATKSASGVAGDDDGMMIRIKASADLHQGPALMRASLDGKVLGEEKVSAEHSKGESVVFDFSGDVPRAGQGTELKISFVNDASGRAGQDRNLWIESVSIDGDNLPVGQAVYDRDSGVDLAGISKMAWNGSLIFDV